MSAAFGVGSERATRLALIVKMPAAATIELAGHVGFDYVLIDTEHGPGGMSEIEHHIRAAECAGIRSLVRVPAAESPEILRALDAGADGIVVPHVTARSDVERARALTQYPPDGRRSLALSTRAGRYGTRSVAEHLEAASRELLLIGQFEDAEALGRIPEILDGEGLDGVFIGPADLSASLGKAGQLDHPTVSGAVAQIAEAVLSTPELMLGVLAGDEAEAGEWTARGASIVFVNEPALLASSLKTIVAAIAQANGKRTARA